MTHPPDYFKLSFLRHFGFISKYSNLPRMIDMIYLGNGSNANCGLIADAVTNFGVFGVIGYPAMFFCIMRIYDKVSDGLDNALKICASLYISIYLVNSFIMTSLVSHGILILFLIIYIMTSFSSRNGEGIEDA